VESGNGEAARPVLGDGEGGLWWSFGSKDVHQGFLKLPSSFSTEQLLWTAAKNSNWLATLGSAGSWLAAKNSHYMWRYIEGFLDRIVVGKDSNTFLVCIELDLTKIRKKSGRG
jgi:hypothetical protein